MPTQESKASPRMNGQSLRNTFRRLPAILKSRSTMKTGRADLGKKVTMAALVRLRKRIKTCLLGEQTIERKTSGRLCGVPYFAALFITALNLSTDRSRSHPPAAFQPSVTPVRGDSSATARWRFAAALNSGRHTQSFISSLIGVLSCQRWKTFCRSIGARANIAAIRV